MVTLADPILKRLVEVNPAPDDFELPPVSDVALFESILERARSEELSFRPVRVRSWRPGVVVAAAAFVAVLAIAGAIGLLSGMFAGQEGPVVTEPRVVSTTAPVPTTVPPTVTTVVPVPTTVTTVAPAPTTVPQYEATINVPDDGSFSASGSAVDAAAMCSEGTINANTISKDLMPERFPAGGEYSDHYWAVEEHTLTCADGSGTIVVGTNVNQAQLMDGYIFFGEWIVVSGTGDYERVTGTGAIDGACDPNRANCTFEYTGRLDHSRDPATAPVVTTPVGRHDVEIVYEGGGKWGRFTATGAAVEAGLFCPDGTMFGGSEDDISPNWWEDVFFCADGTGWMMFGTDVWASIAEAPTLRWRGPWTVLGGSGTYATAAGAGTSSGISLDDGNSETWTYTGSLEISE